MAHSTQKVTCGPREVQGRTSEHAVKQHQGPMGRQRTARCVGGHVGHCARAAGMISIEEPVSTWTWNSWPPTKTEANTPPRSRAEPPSFPNSPLISTAGLKPAHSAECSGMVTACPQPARNAMAVVPSSTCGVVQTVLHRRIRAPPAAPVTRPNARPIAGRQPSRARHEALPKVCGCAPRAAEVLSWPRRLA